MTRSTGYAAFGPNNATQQHHRRTSSLVRKSGPPTTNTTAYKSSSGYTSNVGGSLTESQQALRMKQGFKFPSTPLILSTNNSSDEADSSSSGGSSDEASSSPATSPDSHLMNNGSNNGKPAGLGLQAISEADFDSPLANRQVRYGQSQHRFSPSNPYGPFPDSHSQQQQQELSSMSFFRMVLSKLRRTKVLDLSFGAIFAISLVVFMAALSGVGYQPPSKTTLPLLVPSHIAGAEPVEQRQVQAVPRGADVVQPEEPVHVEPLNAQEVNNVPVIVKDDPENEAEVPFWQEKQEHHVVGGRPMAQAGDGRRQAINKDLEEQIQALKAQQLQELAAQAKVVEDQDTPDLLANSPDDPTLDDAHAAHYHHEQDNVFDPTSDIEIDEHVHDHSFDQMVEAEVFDEEDEEASRDLDVSEMEVEGEEIEPEEQV